jgi:hypothetical protein
MHITALTIIVALTIINLVIIVDKTGRKVDYVAIVHRGGTIKSLFSDDGPSLCMIIFAAPI